MPSIDRPTSDALKGALILLIVLGHNTILTERIPHLFGWLYSFHVLCFMILPWLYGTASPSVRGLARRLRKTYVPYTLFYLLLYGIYNFIFTRRGFDGKLFFGAYLTGGNGPLKESCGFQYLWFLPAYFFMTCFRDLYVGLRGTAHVLTGGAIILFAWLWCAHTRSAIGYFMLPAVGQGLYAAAFGLLFVGFSPPRGYGENGICVRYGSCGDYCGESLQSIPCSFFLGSAFRGMCDGQHLFRLSVAFGRC